MIFNIYEGKRLRLQDITKNMTYDNIFKNIQFLTITFSRVFDQRVA
jgi:hypothetical protein